MGFFGNLVSGTRNLFNSAASAVKKFGAPVYNFLNDHRAAIQGAVKYAAPVFAPGVDKAFAVADKGRALGFYQKGGSVKRRKA